MAALTDTTIASTYKQLLKLTSEGVSADASAKYVEDGLGTDTALSLSTTRVGIGTASPSAELNVEGTGMPSIHISRDKSAGSFDANGWGLGVLAFGGQDSDSGEDNDSAYIRASVPTTAQGGGAWSSSSHPTQLGFYTTPTSATSASERMTISASGDVGIGTTSPGIADEGATVTIEDSSSVPTLELSRKSDSISDNAQVGILRFYHGSSTQRMAGQVDMIEDGTSENAADMRFWTSTGGNLGLGMTINSSGNVGIGTTTITAPHDFNSSGMTALEIRADDDTGDAGVFIRRSSGDVGLDLWTDSSSGKSYIDNRWEAQLHLRTGTRADGGEKTVMTLRDSGHVGIGEVSPDARLEVSIDDGSTYAGHFKNSNGTAPTLWVEATGNDANDTAVVKVDVNSATRFVITNEDGNVGIGETGPDHLLHISHNDDTAITAANIWDGNCSGIHLKKTHDDSDAGSVIKFSADSHTSVAAIAMSQPNSAGDSNLHFYTSDNTTSGHFAERMKIDNSGFLKVPGVYTGNTSSAANVHVTSDGWIYRSTSAKKYKSDIKNYNTGLDMINQMQPVSYKSKKSSVLDENDKTYAGLLADDIHDLGLSEFVEYNKDREVENLFYDRMVVVCINAIKELSKELEDLKNYVDHKQDYNSLAGRINSCEARIGHLEKK